MNQYIRPLLLSVILLTGTLSQAQNPGYKLTSERLSVSITKEGITSLTIPETHQSVSLLGSTRLEGCQMSGKAKIRKLETGAVEIESRWTKKVGREKCKLIERYTPNGEAIHWEVEIHGEGDPWTTFIETGLTWPVSSNSRFWAPWSDPRLARKESSPPGTPVRDQVTVPALDFNWGDPLIPHAFVDDTLWYGAPYFRYEEPHALFVPFQRDLICIPLVSVLEPNSDIGISLILDPNDEILDLTLSCTQDGALSFNRIYNRISRDHPLHFAADLVVHEADWRGGLRWMSRRYPEFFDPVIASSADLAGTGAYSNNEKEFDLAKMKKMAFTTIWQASFDFPYMGMFIPPVAENESWIRFGGDTTSIAHMRNYAKSLKNKGINVLNYFNVTEFGTNMELPVPAQKEIPENEVWKDPNQFFYYHLPESWLPMPGGVQFTWEGGIVTDPGEPVYREFLLDQARKHVKYIPEAAGIAIDRMDWIRWYNENRDDGISWFIDRPARSLVTSWKELMVDLAPIMHDVGKSIFLNNHVKRIDLLKNTEGIYDEFTQAGAPLNTTALMCIRKPTLGWTNDSTDIMKEGPDAFFQKYLYMGAFPMAPFPGNDHSIRPGVWTDRQYLDYGPLLAAMKNRTWVLEPHCIEVADGAAKVNLFEVPGGYVVPVVFGNDEKPVTLILQNMDGIETVRCEALYPAEELPEWLVSTYKNGQLTIEVPLKRGCAMVKIKCLPKNPPKPYGPLPSQAQLKWHRLELYGLVHFSTTTYANLEWGYGDEPATGFNPEGFDAEQIVAAAKAGGLKGLVLVTKHHCGFCLWPSAYNDSYSVKNSPWKNGQGDMVREYATACKKFGLKFGVYLSPWDRNHKDYGKPEYITYYLNQLRELLTQYGPIQEVWLDGANGGDGYYGGARERRTIDKNTYYPFETIFNMVRELQPDAVIFSDVGPDARWVGNESGYGNDTCWATFTPKNRDGDPFTPVPGNTKYWEGERGNRDGKYWIPAESDFPLRRGWFYHPNEHPKSPEKLWDTYLKSVGRGTSMNIGLAPDTRGLLCEEDVEALAGLGQILSEKFANNLAKRAKIFAGDVRNGNPAFGPANLVDNDNDTYWATSDAVTNAGVVFEFDEPLTIHLFRFREYLPLGQRVEGWEVDYWNGKRWKKIESGASIGPCRIVQTEPITTTKVRFRITKSPVCPAIAEFGIY